jgi:hydrogenase maturation protein HypF
MNPKDNEQFEAADVNIIRQRLVVTGVVQGVGFRPFVYGLALDKNLSGFVGNDSSGVFIEIEGPAVSLVAFHEQLVSQSPPLAYIESVTAEMLSPTGETSFIIVHSQAQATQSTLVSPDICICEDCYGELLDPHNRRSGYPFINCTNCGPRFSIIKDIPYDRPLTTMADFPMCVDCQKEYEDPLDRRFHAQPNACSKCGPHIWLELGSGQYASMPGNGSDVGSSTSIIAAVQQLLLAGKIVAVKGLGGFHLACNARDDAALQTLRERKGRVDKPFAVMARDVETVREFADLTVEEEVYLVSKERPVLLVRKKPGSSLSTLVAPGNQYVGVMLPYTPLHFLLFQPSIENNQQSTTISKQQIYKSVERVQSMLTSYHALSVLVMTSANYSDEPIVKDNEEARERLSSLADAFLFHNRDIYARCDDSVIRILNTPHVITETGTEPQQAAGKELHALPIRRSRGYAPFPVKLPFETLPILAVGGELKATFCLAKGQYAYMSQHIGDMENMETLLAFQSAVAHFQHIFRTQPKRIACDLHPRYLSSQWAQQQDDLPVVQVQHHHAHIASVMAEHQLDGSEPVIGFSFDGTGFGSDGAVWGGEVFVADYHGFDRVAHLKYVPLVGGDTAVKRPYRLALSHLWAAGIDWDDRFLCVQACSSNELDIIKRQIETGLNAVPTSSMGRLFDAVASLTGVRQAITYEAQAAIEFEAMTAVENHGCYTFALSNGVFDAAPVINGIAQDVLSGVGAPIIAARFHRAVAKLVFNLSVELRAQTEVSAVALSGGVFQNVTLLTQAVKLLQEAGFVVYYHRLVPPNDGGLALGQAIVAAVSN